MKISKLFHWLYALLMFLPFMAVAFNFIRFGLSSSITLTDWNTLKDLIWIPVFGNLSLQIDGVYMYLLNTIFGLSYSSITFVGDLLTYWTIISIVYLIFDVLMYVPLLVHRWLDKGIVE